MRELKNIVTCRPFVAGSGWRDYVNENEIVGSVGESRQLEAFQLQIENADKLGIVANCYMNGKWLEEKPQGEVIGVPGGGQAIQAVSFNLFGENAKDYDIFYNAHISNIGWIGFCRNGEPCGRTGDPSKYRVEAIQIFVSPKNRTWLGIDSLASFQDMTPPPAPQKEIRSFGDNEFKCVCGCGLDVNYELKVKIQRLRDLLSQRAGHDRPLVITSGARCPAQNKRDGGVSDSLHMKGHACDLYTPGMSRAMVDEIYYCAKQVGLGTIRYYQNLFVHVQLEPRDQIWN